MGKIKSWLNRLNNRFDVGALVGIVVLVAMVGSGIAIAGAQNAEKTRGDNTSSNVKTTKTETKTCDGTTITSNCVKDGVKYATYVNHPAEPAQTHTVDHPAEMGTRQVQGGCIQTSISYKSGTCALSQCRDGSYSGSTGRGTCSYHGGVARSGGPWYEYHEESYVIKAAWTETVVDVPAKDAWTETVVAK